MKMRLNAKTNTKNSVPSSLPLTIPSPPALPEQEKNINPDVSWLLQQSRTKSALAGIW